MSATSNLRAPDIVPFVGGAPGRRRGPARRAPPRAPARRARPRPALRGPCLAREEIDELVRADGASGVAAWWTARSQASWSARPRDASWGAEHVGRAGGPRRRRGPSSCATSTPSRPRNAGSPTASPLHYAMVPATDPALVDAWFRLGFGHQHVHAIREAPSAGERSAGPPGLIAPPCAPRGPRRARAARCRAARAPGALARLLAPPAADRRGRPSRVRGGLRRPEVHDVRRRAGRRGDRLRDRVPDRGVLDAQEPRALAGRRLPRLRVGAARRRGAAARDACWARRCSTGRGRPGANGSSPTGA